MIDSWVERIFGCAGSESSVNRATRNIVRHKREPQNRRDSLIRSGRLEGKQDGARGSEVARHSASKFSGVRSVRQHLLVEYGADHGARARLGGQRTTISLDHSPSRRAAGDRLAAGCQGQGADHRLTSPRFDPMTSLSPNALPLNILSYKNILSCKKSSRRPYLISVNNFFFNLFLRNPSVGSCF